MQDDPQAGSVPSIPLAARYASRPAGQWSVLGAVSFVVVVMGSAVLFGAVLQHLYLAFGLGLGLRGSFGTDAAARLGAEQRRDLFLGVQVLAQVLQLSLIWLLAGWWHGKARHAALNLAPVHLGLRGWLGAILLLFAIKIAATAVAGLLTHLNPREELAPFINLARQPATWAIFLLTVVLAGATEELLFRGVLSRTLEATRLGFWGGAAVASASFAALHLQYGIGGQLVIFAVGMTLAWIRHRAGTLWPAIVCHSLNNAVALVALWAVG